MNNKESERTERCCISGVCHIFVRSTMVYQSVRSTRKEITWKNFQQLVQNDKIESVEVNQNKVFRQDV